MHFQRKHMSLALAVLSLGLAISILAWSGCTALFPALTASAGSNITMTLGQSVVLQGSASGGSGQYSYSWSPTAGLSNAGVDRPTFTPTTVGSRVFTLTVTDSIGNTATATTTVTVATNSPALVASAGANFSAALDTLVTLHGSAIGGSGQYTYAWDAPAGIVLAGANTATPTFTPTAAAAYTFTLTVTDTEGTTAQSTVIVTASTQATLSSLTWGANISTGGYRVVAVFSQPLNATSAQTVANYRLTGTATVPTSATLASDSRTVTLAFNVALASTSQFDLSVGGNLIDAAGNSVAEIPGQSPAPNSGDTTPPSISSCAWGPLVSGGYQVNVVFSKVLDKTSTQTTTAYRINGTSATAQSVTLGSDGRTAAVIFSNNLTLTSSSRIDVSVGGVIKDINGNALAVQLNQAITGTINAPTTVTSVTWGANYAGGGYKILVVFSQALNTTSAQSVDNWRISGTSSKPASATLGADGKTVTLIFSVALATTDKLDISVGGGLKDTNGNTISEQLDQAIAADTTGDVTVPSVVSATWATNFTGDGYMVYVVFSEAMDRTSVQSASAWRINGDTTTPSTVTLGTDGKTVTLVFLAPLAITNKLDVGVGGTIRDINANAMAQQLGQAITAGADVTLPTVSTVNWAAHFGSGGYQVLVVFNEAMDRTSAETLVNYQIDGVAPGAAAPTSATLKADGKTVALVFAGLRHIGDTLDISIGATIKDINGNAAAVATDHAIAANTADTTGPNISSRFWKAGVATYQAVVAFSDAMDPVTTETVGYYSMTVNGGAAINPTTATLDVDGVTVTLDFGAGQAFKTADLLTVTAAVKNINGRANTSATAAAMTAVSGTRAAAASYVWVAPPASYQITLTFAEVMDIASTTTLANYTLGGQSPNTATLSASGLIATLTWTSGAFAVTDQLSITTGVKNIRGDSKAEAVTVTSGGGAGPTITSRMWGANQATYKAIVLFSQVMDKTSAATAGAGSYNLGGATGTAASLATDGKTVTVTFGTGALNAADSLTVAGAVHNINAVANTSVAAVAVAVNPADTTAPIPQTAVKVDATHVDITFNEVVDKATAEAAAYAITGGAVSAAALQAGGLKVRLTTTVDPTTRTVTVPTTVTDVNAQPVAVATPLAVSG